MSMRVLIVEDNKVFASLMADRLGRSGFESDLVGSLAQAKQAVAAVEYAAIVLDLGLEDGDGLDLLHGLRKRGSSIPVVITSARHSLEDRVRGLREGADDYLAKPFSVEELIARLQAVMRRPGKFLGLALQSGNVALDTESRQVRIADAVQIVRVRETLMLELLMRHAGNVVPRHHFEQQLFGYDNEHDSNTVDVYVHRLRRQLLDAGATVMIHTIRGVGYMLTEVKQAGGEDAGQELCAPP
jgi:DNA-binding response OmpR family regulator